MELQSAKDTFEKFLKEARHRITPERFEVLEAVITAGGHFDVDQLHVKMKSSGSKVSRATVYNTLDLLLKCGLISKYRFGENHSRFEKAFGRPHHDHLICLQCGEIIEFMSGRLLKLQAVICKKNKFQPQSSTLQIFGICSKCQRATEK